MPAGPQWRPFLVALLIIELTYVLAEFGFNAAILNVASGAVLADPGTVKKLETFGQTLSGIGLGLLIYSALLIARTKKAPTLLAQVLMAILIFPPAIYSMHELQTWIVDEAIPSQSSDSAHFAASYLQFLGPAIRNGLIQIEDVPITPASVNQPDAKAFLTLLAPALLNDTHTVQKIAAVSTKVIRQTLHNQAIVQSEQAYEHYESAVAMTDFDQLYKHYYSASRMTEIRVNQEKAKIKNDRSRLYLQWRIQTTWYAYHLAEFYQNPLVRNIPPGLSAYDFPAHPEVLKLLGFTDQGLVSKVKSHHFKVTQNRATQKITSVEVQAFLHMVIDYEASKVFSREWAKKADQVLGIANNLPIEPGMSKAEFFRSNWLQASLPKDLIRQLDGPLVPGVSSDDFFNEYVLPAAQERAQSIIDELPRTAAAIDANTRENATALKSVYVPAIALVFSLFFSLATLGKIATRLWSIWRCGSPYRRRHYRLTKVLVGTASIVMIIAIPLTMTPSSLAQTKALELAAQSSLPAPAIKVLRWTMDTEPLIFPLGNALLSLPWAINPLHIYYDRAASNASVATPTKPVKSINLIAPEGMTAQPH
jgi:hypothetical protein